MKQPVLKSERLRLRNFELQDSSQVQKLAGNINVARTTLNIPHPYNDGMAEEWIQSHKVRWQSRSQLIYAITKLDTKQLVGAVAPNLLPYELGNALSAMLTRKQLSSEEVILGFEYASKIPVQLIEIDISKALNIAIQYNIYAYDAYFLQAALQNGYPLLSLDKKMCQVAKKLNIKVLELTL